MLRLQMMLDLCNQPRSQVPSCDSRCSWPPCRCRYMHSSVAEGTGVTGEAADSSEVSQTEQHLAAAYW
jgi:hypothetical protein